MKIGALRVAHTATKKLKYFQPRYGRKIHSELDSLHLKSATWYKKSQPSNKIGTKCDYLRRGTKANYLYEGTFQEAIAPVLVLAQIFALMPVKGICQSTAEQLQFSWLCWRSFYALVCLFCYSFCSILTIIFACRHKFNFDSVETIIFYTSIFFIAAAFLRLASKWPSLMLQWQMTERQLPPLHTQTQKSALAYRIKMITIVAGMCSLLEHILSMLSKIYYVNICPAIPNHLIDSFLYDSFSQYFNFFAYNSYIGVLGKVLNVLSTFAWNFNDIFVMVISVSLTARFHQLNEHMASMAKKIIVKEDEWIEARTNYRNICKLLNIVDDAISGITLLCFSNNLYFICGKILKSIQKKPSVSHTLYFWFSLFFLIGRTFVLSQFASAINDESKRPLLIFRLVRREAWCAELKRFSEEVATDVVALSGMKFFKLTRSLLLSVAGTIVTYEFVLLQFSKEPEDTTCFR